MTEKQKNSTPPPPEEGNFVSAKELFSQVKGETEASSGIADQIKSPLDLIEKKPVLVQVVDEDGNEFDILIKPPRMKQYLRGMGGLVKVLSSLQRHSPERFSEFSKKVSKEKQENVTLSQMFELFECLGELLFLEPETVVSIIVPFLPDEWDEERLLTLDPIHIIDIIKVVAILIDLEKLMVAFNDALPIFKRVVGRNPKVV